MRCQQVQQDGSPFRQKAAVLLTGFAATCLVRGMHVITPCAVLSGNCVLGLAKNSGLIMRACRLPQALCPVPAHAEAGLGTKSKQIEAELQRILESRGITLQQLESSPKARPRHHHLLSEGVGGDRVGGVGGSDVPVYGSLGAEQLPKKMVS